jgi:hypothetical protein
MTVTPRRTALLASLGLLLVICAAPAAARENETFGLTPFPEEKEGVNRLGFEVPRQPGAIFEDAVKIYNRTNQTLPLRVYATDAEATADETITVRFGSKDPTGVGDWIDLARDQLELLPRQEVVVTFRIDVKSDDPSPNLGAIVVEHTARGLASAQRLYLVVRTAPPGASTTSDRVRPLMLRSPWVILAILGLLVGIALVWIGTRRARRSKDVLVPAGEIGSGVEEEPIAPDASRPVIKRLGEPEPGATATAVLERSTRPLPRSDHDDRPLLDDAFLVEVEPHDDEDDEDAYDDELDEEEPEDDELVDDEPDLPPARHRPVKKPRSRQVSATKRKPARSAAKKKVAASTKHAASARAKKNGSKRAASKKGYIPLDDL